MRRWLQGILGTAADDGLRERVEAHLVDLLEHVRKAARSSAKAVLRLDEIERKMDASFVDVCARIGALETAAPAIRWEDLLDALDALDRAVEAADRSTDDGMSDGLRAISGRLERVLEQGAVKRLDGVGELPDGRLFRVVGTESVSSLPDGAVVRVVRAAARTTAGRMVREGEVVVNKRSAE